MALPSVPPYVQGSDLPYIELTWKDTNDVVIDFSTGHTFQLKIGNPGEAALITKTTGITGAATSPNVTIAWASTGELNTLETGSHIAQLKATRNSDGKDRFFRFVLPVEPAIT